ncbi:MAG TPA: tetratricopeptide repeat protein [Candidatus Binatia bacterium]|nr:tetratricopeptide repeat protein [Candidatus Binatia bacterium]
MKTAPLFLIALALAACASYRVAGQIQSGRQALLMGNPETALAYFQEAVKTDPDHIFQLALYRESVWTYLGRAQYNLGRFEDARHSFARALSIYPDDSLARLYLGLTLLRQGDQKQGRAHFEAGLRGLHDWLEYINAARPFEAFWDPRREIRSTIEKTLAALSERDADWPALVATGEWIGRRMEQELDYVRRDEQRYFRDRDIRRGSGIGVGIGF